MSMQTTGDRADFPAGTAVSGSSTADSSGINGPFTVYDTLMRERDALIYYRQMLERKRSELEQSLQKQRSEGEVCPALFVLSSAEALLRVTHSNRVRRTFSTHGIAHQCVHNSAVLSSWSTPIGSGEGAIGMKECQKLFLAQYLMRTMRHVKEVYLYSANQVAAMRAFTTFHTAPMLRRLELDVSDLGEEMVQNIYQWEIEGQLEYVAVRLCNVTSTLPLLCSLSSLRSLDLSHTTLTSEDLRGLQGCHNLIKLDLSYCRGMTDLSPILHIRTLEVVKVSGCRQLVGIGSLGRLPSLKELELSETGITDEEICQLSECRTLVKIDLSSCEELTNVNPLSSIKTLEVINLSRCISVTHLGALGKLPALKEVYLSYTRITDEELRVLSECHALVKIDLSWCDELTNVNPLSFIKTLEVVDLAGCSYVTHVGALGTLPVLKEVDLRYTRITDEEIRQLSECHTLVKIDLSSCDELTSVNPLSSIAILEAIDLSYCTSVTHLGVLSKLPVLTEVYLGGTRITDEDVRQLSECHTLVKIDMHSCEELTNVNPLSSIKTLEVINLSDCPSLTHVGRLSKLPVLKEVDLSETHITDEELDSFTSLRAQLGLPSVVIKR